MIPLLVAREVKDTLLDYLRSTWQLADKDLEKALFAFLSGERGMFKGPWVRLGLPFAQAPSGAPVPLDVRPPYRPYLHQLLAWQRLSSRDGHEPEATIVTTGTGSGKTECFLYPILDHALRALNAREKGIGAIVLYPMNALASDQARRMAEIVHADERLRGRLRIGLFVGGEGRHREMGKSHVIDDSDHLRKHPPDILLTNYRMLDLLLQRPRDAGLWAQNKPGRLRYLVLDELHTYDGAQGTDVACLIRRLGARLGAADAICPVGTSATVSGGADTTGELLRFAERVFDHPFHEDALVGETRVAAEDLLAGFGPERPATIPADPGALAPEPQDEAEAHVRAVAAAWFPGEKDLAEAAGDDFRVQLGAAVLGHPLGRALVRAASGAAPIAGDGRSGGAAGSGAAGGHALVPWAALCSGIAAREPALAGRGAGEVEVLLGSLLTLLSWAKRRAGGRSLPLVNVQVQVWVREVRRLLCDVAETWRFRWLDDGAPPDGVTALPLAVCRECGHAGWITRRDELGGRIETDYAAIASAAEQRSPEVTYLHRDESVRDEDGAIPARWAFDPAAGTLLPGKELRPGRVAVFWKKDEEGASGRGRQKCPACGARDAMRFLASRSASLTSVAVGHLFTTPLNTDRKLLAFSDSVQDASHRAGFFGGRTYRFALRSAMLAVIPGEGAPYGGGPIPLADVSPAMEAHWQGRLREGRFDGPAAFVAAFLPHDLEFLEENVAYERALADHGARMREAEARGEPAAEPTPAVPPMLVAKVGERLRWEVTRELGVAARIGRTLEQSGCVAVTVDPDRFARAVDRAAGLLPSLFGALQGVGRAAFAGLVAGLVTRVRLRGGIFDPLLANYVESGGAGIFLSKARAPLLSPFGRFTTRPIFLTSEPKPRRFESLSPGEKRTWVTDWWRRATGVDLDTNEARDLGAALAPILVEAGIFGERASGAKHKVWGLLPEALLVTRSHAARQCPVCGNRQASVPGAPTDLLGGPCLRYRCDGRYEAVSEDEGRVATYYRRYYARGTLGRVFPREHTGLLTRPQREDLEVEFKERPRPNAANLLSCTPTLEMGIDIGDLSATLLCSVPPSPASYVQRAGRAGRATGNALLVTFAATRPHDLYYYEDPIAVMAGAIHPPGCFLDAPEVLKRQALAFAFDRLARDGHKMPGRLGQALGDANFPAAPLGTIAGLRGELSQGFLELFAKQLTGDSRKRVAAFFDPEGDGLAPIERRLSEEIGRAREQVAELRARVKRIDGRIEKLKSDEAERKKVEDADAELKELSFERISALKELAAFLEQDLWGFLCERSALPNYAFPEAGVRLDAFVRREGPGAEPEHWKWVRPPASAIVELAPFNTFYGSARHVVVQNLDLKHGGAPAGYQLCSACHHMQEVSTMPDPPPPSCPACGAGGWGEVGRRRWLAPMTHVRAFAFHRDAMVGDENEDRERAHYESHNFFDAAGVTPSPAWLNRERGFGFELLGRLTLRRINFGPRDAKANRVSIAGREVPEVRFVVCAECGQVQPDEKLLAAGWPPHWQVCANRKAPKEKQVFREVHLVRRLTSEALRVVVPISEHRWDVRLPNLRAALRLGLRRYFGGDPDHLWVDSYDEPLPVFEGRRRYLVVMDLVPGGTGMLADLAHGKGQKLRQVLALAKEAIEKCPCNKRTDGVRACHLCLYAYRDQTALALLDREVALDEIDAILASFDGLALGDTVGSLRQESVLESELEARFVEALDTWARQQATAEVAGGAAGAGGTSGEPAGPANAFERVDAASWRLTVGGRRWLVRAQVVIEEDRAEVACRPDFVLYPEGQEPGVLPVAVFADGAAFHVMPGAPRGRIADDLRKRLGLSRPGGFLTWSLTWRDVTEFRTQATADGVPPWAPDADFLVQLRKMAAAPQLGLEKLLAVVERDPMTGLLAHLAEPRKLRTLAAVVGAVLAHRRGRLVPGAQAEAEHGHARTAVSLRTALPELVPSGDTVVAKTVIGGENEAALVLSVPREALGALVKAPDRAALTLRLQDGPERRAAPGFQTAWRQTLRAWNLLQALPGAVVTTFEQLGEAWQEPAAEARAEAAPVVEAATVPRAATVPPASLGAELEGLLVEVRDERARAAVRGVLLRGGPVPAVPYEVRAGLKGSVGDIEVGWEAARVGAYLDEQRDAADRLRAQGWTLLPIEAGLTEAALCAALGLEG